MKNYQLKISAAAVLLTLASTSALAIERVNISKLTCATVQKIVAQQGAVILRYPSKRIANYTLYDRYVANSSFCRFGEQAKLETVPTKDTQRCRVYVCGEQRPLFDDLFN